jgi:hypothetical protein
MSITAKAVLVLVRDTLGYKPVRDLKADMDRSGVKDPRQTGTWQQISPVLGQKIAEKSLGKK